MPRHPPFALRNLTTKIKIAIRHHPQPSARRPQIDWMTRIKDARVHCVVLNIRSAPHSPPSNDSASCGPTKDTPRITPCGPTPNPPHSRSGSLVPQDPTTCTSQPVRHQPVPTPQAERTEASTIGTSCTVNVPPMSYPSDTFGPNQAPGPCVPQSRDNTRPDAP